MSRASRRRREQLSRAFRRLPPEQRGAMALAGFVNAIPVVGLGVVMAAMLARSVRGAWRERQRGPAGAVRAGVTPGLIELAGAMSVNGVIKDAVFRAILDPELNSAEPGASRRLRLDPAVAIAVLGFINSFSVVGLDGALAVVLDRSVRRAWRERQRGPASAVRAGVTPGLIELAGAMVIQEVVRAVALRAIVAPALNGPEPDPSPSSW